MGYLPCATKANLCGKVALVQPCCREDEGGPFEIVVQEMISNHHKLLWSKATVVSVMEKARLDLVRYVLRRRTQ